MNPEFSQRFSLLVSRAFVLLCVSGVSIAVGFLVGCGGSAHVPSSQLSGNTTLVLLASSTANDQLPQFGISLNSISLTNLAGKTVSLLSTKQDVEFIDVNGTAKPLVTVSVPQDVYTSAAVTFGDASITCLVFDPSSGNIVDHKFANKVPGSASVTLPAPLTITGSTMGLSLDLQVSQSATWPSCLQGGIQPFSITPTFHVTPLAISTQPTNSTNGLLTNLQGMVSSVESGGASFKVTGADGPNWQVTSSGSTVYQNITGPAQLTVGMPLDMDIAIQQDGSLLATRIAVYDSDTVNLTVSRGPLLYVNEYEPMLDAYGVAGQGPLSAISASAYDFNNAVFQTSGRFTNIQSLPFPASFSSSNMVAGQNIFISTHALTVSGGFPYTSLTTVTLLPQTINGTVRAVSNSGNFTTYTVTLADYDLFPEFSVQPGQTTLLTTPGSVVVYVNGNTQLLNTGGIAVGSTLRFNGLVFNDNGTLRMDCAQVNDGEAE